MNDSFTYSRIYLQTGLSGGSHAKILIGNMAELVVADVRCLGLLALPDLPSEADGVSDVFMRNVFAKGPFTTLERMFDEAWETAEPGESLSWLAKSYQLTVLVESPAELPIPTHVDWEHELAHERAVVKAMQDGWNYNEHTPRRQLRT